MINDVTPVILTLNEGPNLARTLSKLSWAREIIVVDSGSTDETLAIAASNPAVRVISRAFDGHANQWNFAVAQTGIGTPWVLALDADYVLSDALVDEIKSLRPDPEVHGYRVRFVYCVDGNPLRGTLYPPVTVLFRRQGAQYVQDGHTQRVHLEGSTRMLSNVIFHDDRKSLSRWLQSQRDYARIEAEKYLSPAWRPRRWTEFLRSLRVVAPLAMLGYCLFVKLLILDGWPGIFYSLQRSYAELLLSLHLIAQDLKRNKG